MPHNLRSRARGREPRLRLVAAEKGLAKHFAHATFDKPRSPRYQRHPLASGILLFMATTSVILTEKIGRLGVEGDIVKVRAGYARNFLIPQGKALEKTKAAEKRINLLKAKRAEREATELNEAEELARRIGKLRLTMELETGETGKAFGSVTAADLAEKIKGELGGKVEVDRHRIQLDRPIKESGDHEVPIKLHADVIATLRVHLKAKGATEPAPAPAEEPKPEEKGFRARPKAKHTK